MEGPIRPKHHPRPLAVVSRMSADRLWLAHGRLWLTLPKNLQVLTSARLSPAHARLWLSAVACKSDIVQLLIAQVPSKPAT